MPGCKNSFRQHADPSLDWRRVVNIFLAMTRSSLRIQTVCFGVIATLAFATAVPAWAQEEPSSEYVDPTIVKDEPPEGVKNLGAEQAVTKKKWEYDYSARVQQVVFLGGNCRRDRSSGRPGRLALPRPSPRLHHQ